MKIRDEAMHVIQHDLVGLDQKLGPRDQRDLHP